MTRTGMCFGFCPEMSRGTEAMDACQYGPRDDGGMVGTIRRQPGVLFVLSRT